MENYTPFLVKQGVSQKYVTWYVLRTKQYIAYFPDNHIRTHTAQQVEEYLTKVGREVNLKAWQFGQVVDTIRILFCLALKKSWANNFDWEYWSASAKKLDANHATVARDYTDALAGLEGLEMLEGEERCSHELYQRYQPALAEVVKAVRLKNYAMRTEQTYRGWIARFFYFHKPNNVHDLGAKRPRKLPIMLSREIEVLAFNVLDERLGNELLVLRQSVTPGLLASY